MNLFFLVLLITTGVATGTLDHPCSSIIVWYCNKNEFCSSLSAYAYCFVAVSGLICYDCVDTDKCQDTFKKDAGVANKTCAAGEVCHKVMASGVVST